VPSRMSPSASANPWTPATPEAQRLADALRHCRLTLLYAAAGAGKTALLVHGLLPSLHRRAADAAVGAPRPEPTVILPFPERRSRARARLAELVVHVDGWSASPLADVHDALDEALRSGGVDPSRERAPLPERVQALGERYGMRLLFVFDHLDALIAPQRAHDDVCVAFIGELVQLLNRRLPANLLIALRSESEPWFADVGERLFGVDAEVYRLPARPDDADDADRLDDRGADAAASTDAGARAADEGDAPAAPPRLRIVRPGEPPPHAAPRRPAAPALARVGALGRMDGAEHADLAPVSIITALQPSRPASALARTAPPEATAAPRTLAPALLRASRRPPRRVLHAIVVLVLLALLAIVLAYAVPRIADALRQRDELAAAAATVRVPPPAPVSAAHPAMPLVAAPAPAQPPPTDLDLVVDAETGVPPQLATELASALSMDTRLHVRVAAAPADPRRLHLAVMRYGALKAAAQQPARAAGATIGVVAPLFTQELYAIVRADAPLRTWQDLQGRRINVGPPQGARALTVRAVYARLFDARFPHARESHVDAPAALHELTAGRTLDAVIWVGAQPDELWAGLAPPTRERLRLLRLDPASPAVRRAQQDYLPATLHEPGLPGGGLPTLAALSFLVVQGPSDAAAAPVVAQVAASLCSHLAALKRHGDPKWREVGYGLQLATPWPAASAAQAPWRACRAPGVASTAGAGPGQAAITPSSTAMKGTR